MKYLFLIVLAFTLCCCSSFDPEQTLQQAEADAAAGNIDRARSGCASLDDSVKVALTSTQMCRVALVYTKLSETSDDQADMAAAARYFSKAVDSNPDSVDIYLGSLPIEDRAHAAILREICRSLETPQCDLADEDSCGYEIAEEVNIDIVF